MVDRSPLKPTASSSSAHRESKRATGSNPMQLNLDNAFLGVGHVKTTTDNLEHTQTSPDSVRAAIVASVEANRAWKGLAGSDHSQVFERVICTLTLELANVDKAQWGNHLHQRLGKVAGFECKKLGECMDWLGICSRTVRRSMGWLLECTLVCVLKPRLSVLVHTA